MFLLLIFLAQVLQYNLQILPNKLVHRSVDFGNFENDLYRLSNFTP